MEGDGALLDFASGDNAPVATTAPAESTMKREQDSTDDFEHLDREPKREEAGESPVHARANTQTASQSFLDMERDEPAPPRPPSTAEKLSDHLADKFTDSESEPGDSPLHRPQPPQPPPSAPAVNPPPAPQPTPSAPAVNPPPVQQPAAAPSPQPAPPRAPTAHVIEAEVIFRQMGLVESLIYWRQPAASGAALGGGLALLVALACCSVVSVLAYGSLLALSAAVAFRLYRSVLQAVQKTNDGHPFKALLERDVSVPAERAQAAAAAGTAHLNAALHELRRLFLVEDLVDSLKFGVLLWCLTYVGACFNGITLIILGWIALFTLPKAYEVNKAQVDANLELARAKINEISAKVRAAVPLGRKAESDKDK